MTLYDQYIKAVKSGARLECRYIRLAITRHLNDLKRSKKKDYPYEFNLHKAERAIKICKLLRHTKSKWHGKLFNLKPFQAFILASLFGWVRKDNGLRRFRRFFCTMGRKNAKTELAAVIAVIGLLFDNEHGAEIYTAATKKDQAKICFNAARIMLKQLCADEPEIDRLMGFHRNNIFVSETESFLTALSSDFDKMDGLNCHMAIVDEYSQHKTNDILETLQTSMGTRPQPLSVIISTDSFQKKSPFRKLKKTCIQILKGVLEDERTFAMIYTLDKDDDWKDKTVWPKPNPLVTEISPDFLEDEFQMAINEGHNKEIFFKTKYLNIETQTAATWIQDDTYKACGHEYSISTLEGKFCHAGLDLASTRDLTDLCLWFPIQDGLDLPHIIHFIYCPEETADKRSISDGVPYREWASLGYLKLTPGNVTDYGYIEQDILSISEKVDLRSIAYDRHNASQLIINLQNEGYECSPFGQGFVSMSMPTKELEKLYLSNKLKHNNNPCVRWQFSNVLLKLDPAGNVKIDKGKSEEKVDSCVSEVMALGEAIDKQSDSGEFEVFIL